MRIRNLIRVFFSPFSVDSPSQWKRKTEKSFLPTYLLRWVSLLSIIIYEEQKTIPSWLIWCSWLASIYPPWSECEALRLGVHLILLYFIRISLLYPESFFLFCWCWCWCWCGCGCGWRTFFVFKSLDINIIYSLDRDVYVHKRNRCTTKVLWV